MSILENIFLLARKYRIGKQVININKSDLIPGLQNFKFQDEKVFKIDSPEDIHIGQITEIASIVQGVPETSRPFLDLGDDFYLVLPNVNFFSAGHTVSIPFIIEEDTDMRNQRIYFIQAVMEHDVSFDEALEYSYYFVNNAYYGTRYKKKEERLDYLLSLL